MDGLFLSYALNYIWRSILKWWHNHIFRQFLFCSTLFPVRKVIIISKHFPKYFVFTISIIKNLHLIVHFAMTMIINSLGDEKTQWSIAIVVMDGDIARKLLWQKNLASMTINIYTSYNLDKSVQHCENWLLFYMSEKWISQNLTHKIRLPERYDIAEPYFNNKIGIAWQ